jgi:hypothetical protein
MDELYSLPDTLSRHIVAGLWCSCYTIYEAGLFNSYPNPFCS